MIDFNKIKEQYPKSYYQLGLWLQPVDEGYKEHLKDNPEKDYEQLRLKEVERDLNGDWEHCSIHYRQLYDFFDEQNIYMEIMIVEDMVRESAKVNSFYVNAFNKDGTDLKICEKDFYKNRKEAEAKGFNECFQLLEEKLTNNK